MDIIRVFVNEKLEYGNPVGIIIDEGKKITPLERQSIATKSGLSEIVFINNINENNISIFSPTREIPFAGQAVIGTSFYLDRMKESQINNIYSMGTNILVRHEKNKVLVQAELIKMPKFVLLIFLNLFYKYHNYNSFPLYFLPFQKVALKV